MIGSIPVVNTLGFVVHSLLLNFLSISDLRNLKEVCVGPLGEVVLTSFFFFFQKSKSKSKSHIASTNSSSCTDVGFATERFVTAPDPELICGICRDILNDPVMVTPCEHTFCSGCTWCGD